MRKTTIAAVLVALAAAVLAVAATARPADRFTLAGTVSRVVDGDTIDVRLASGTTERVRLIGIDTPERGECQFSRAAAEARGLALGRPVVLRGDRTQARRDRYRRLLAYADLGGGRDLGARLLAAGVARVYVYGRPFERLAAYRSAEAAARKSLAGIWGAACAAPGPPPPTAAGCDPSYPSVCIPPPPPDLDCADVPHTGFRVLQPDPHRFDGDRDGVGCEG